MASVLSKRPLRAAKRLVGDYGRLRLGDSAAALTYFAVLSIFPALIVFLSLIGIFGTPATAESLLDVVSDLAPGSAAETFEDATQELVSGSGAGIALVLGIVVALYSASGYTGAFSRAANDIYEVRETRPFWRTIPRQLLITLSLMLGLALALLALVVTGPLAEAIGDEVGVGDTAQTVFSIARWPVLAAVVCVLFAGLLYEGPNVEHESFRRLLPGALVAMSIWLLASLGFSAYVANFGSYASTYGSVAGVIVFLVWLWISNLALLIGAVYNVELGRERGQVTEAEAMTGDEPAERPVSATPA